MTQKGFKMVKNAHFCQTGVVFCVILQPILFTGVWRLAVEFWPEKHFGGSSQSEPAVFGRFGWWQGVGVSVESRQGKIADL